MNRTTLTALLGVTLAVAAQAATLYWDGTGNSWNHPGHWSTDPTATTPNPATAPGSSDIAVFNIDGVVGAQSVTLDADQAASKLTVQGTATGGVALTGGGTDRTLSLGTGGIEVLDGAGPVVIGSKAAGQGVVISMSGNQTWTNGCANAVIVQNGITAPGTQTLTLRGPGGFRLNGPGTYTGGTILTTSTVGIGDDAALGTGTFTLNTGTLLVDDFPRTIVNKAKVNGGTTYWDGDGALTLAGTETTPGLAITQYANPNIHLMNTAPLTVSGIYSLCDPTTTRNNNAVGPSLASSANLVILGDLQDHNDGNVIHTDNAALFRFNGTGANVTLAGDNRFGEGAGRSTEMAVNANAGYNTITVGGPGGFGATITPFGLSALFTNNGRGFFLKALEDGQIMANNISLGNSTNNDGGRPIGFDGEHSLTLGGVFSLGQTISFPNLATGALTFGGTLNAGARTFTILGPGDTLFSASSLITGTTGSFAKTGPGTLTLAGSNDLTGSTTFNGGTVVLDYSAETTNRLTQGTTTAALTLGGVDLQLKGGAYAQALGAGGGTTLGAGQSRVRRNGGSSTLALGAITRSLNLGNVVDFASGVASTTSANTSGLLGSGGFATVDGADWAVGDGTITALASYDSFAVPGTDRNVLQVGSASLVGSTINTLKLDTTEADQVLTLSSGILTLDRRGVLFVGAHDYEITGGSIRGRDGYQEELIVHQYGSGTLTIASLIANRSNSALVKAGPGTLVLTNPANAYQWRTFINDGVLVVSESGNLGNAGSNNGLTLNGGTLHVTTGFATSRGVSLGANGGTFQVDAGTLELSGTVSGGYGALNKTGAGSLLLSGNNAFSGPTTVLAGTLQLGSGTALGASATTANRAVDPVTVSGSGVLDIAGQVAAIGNFTLESGVVTDSVGGGTLGAYSFTLLEGTVSAVLTDVVVPNTSNPSHRISLTKRGAGEAVIASTSLYSGHTFVDDGTLRINGSLPNSPALVRTGGTLGGNGNLSRTVNVEGGTLAPGTSATAPGALTLGRHLRIDDGTLRIVLGASGNGGVVLTNPDARVLLDNAALDVEVLAGAVTGGELTIVDNQGSNAIEGTFAGLPEGGFFDAGTRRFAITYQGGTGNDVVLSFIQRASIILLR